MRLRRRSHGDWMITASDGMAVTVGATGCGVGPTGFSIITGGAGGVAGRCGAELHATSVRHAAPSVQQPVPRAASRQSRVPLFADTRTLISREVVFRMP